MLDLGRGSSAPGPARDFVGYGRTPPKVTWPGGAKLAVNIVINYEEGGEYSMLDDGVNDSWGEYSFQFGPDVRDLATETHMEFGSRVGMWRLADLVESYGVKITVDAVALALERNPEVASWLAGSDHDLVGHGYRWFGGDLPPGLRLSREQEREQMHRAVASFLETTGRRVQGWISRSFPTPHTRELLVEEGGFLYDSDPCNDELPYYVEVSGQPFLIVPYSKIYNDVRYLIAPTYSTPRDFFESLRSASEYMLWEADQGRGGRILTVGLHARWSGQASRASAVRDFLDYAVEREGITFMRRVDIAKFWLETFPPG